MTTRSLGPKSLPDGHQHGLIIHLRNYDALDNAECLAMPDGDIHGLGHPHRV